MVRMTLNEYVAAELAPFPTTGIWTTFPTINGESWETLFALKYGARKLFTRDSALFKSTLRFRASVALPFFKDKLDALAAQLTALKADSTVTDSKTFAPPAGVASSGAGYVAGHLVTTVTGAAGTNVGNMSFIEKEFLSMYEQALDSFENLFLSVIDGEVLIDDD